MLKLSDFYFTGDDYRYRFEPDARQRFIDLVRERFNAGVAYKGRILKWDTIIEEKVSELGRVLVSKLSKVDFGEPAPKLLRYEDRELRGRILALTETDARERGIGKSTLHYLRKRATRTQSVVTYASVSQRLGLREVIET